MSRGLVADGGGGGSRRRWRWRRRAVARGGGGGGAQKFGQPFGVKCETTEELGRGGDEGCLYRGKLTVAGGL